MGVAPSMAHSRRREAATDTAEVCCATYDSMAGAASSR